MNTLRDLTNLPPAQPAAVCCPPPRRPLRPLEGDPEVLEFKPTPYEVRAVCGEGRANSPMGHDRP